MFRGNKSYWGTSRGLFLIVNVILAGMRPFIPDEDFNTYETFLESNGLGQANINETHSSHNSRFR